MVYFSTSEVYGNLTCVITEGRYDLQTTNRYVLFKYLGEKLLEYEYREHKLDVTVLRPFMFYREDETRGAHRSAMIRFAEDLSRRERITVHKDSRRGWLHIDDAVRAIARCVELTGLNTINIGHPEVVETEWLATYMGDLLGVDARRYMDIVELPGRMTLEKFPALDRQKELLDFEPTVDIKE